MIISREIDFDQDNHILFDKWIYISIDKQVSFEDVCSVVEKAQLLRLDIQKIIHSNIQEMQALPFLNQQQFAVLKGNLGEMEKSDLQEEYEHSSKQFTMDRKIPNPVRMLKTSIDCERPLLQTDVLKRKLMEFMKIVIPFSVEDIGTTKVKALFVCLIFIVFIEWWHWMIDKLSD